MDIARLISDLSEPSAYSDAVGSVEVRQTHISAVFLVGDLAYKIKKSVHMGFLDFSTLERRHHFCLEEVRLNRRLAPSVYLGVVPIVQDAGRLRVGGPGTAVEWAVKMRRLPDEATLRSRLSRGVVDAVWIRSFARKVALFHADAESGPTISAAGRFETVAGNCRENFEQALPQVGHTVERGVFDRIRRLTEDALARFRPRIESRAARGVPRDTHGDLRLDHIYLFPDRAPPNDLVVIDCIEFNERFRFADPVADMAFVVMDLTFEGRRDLVCPFADAYFESRGDDEGRELLPLYTAYRAAVRAKVDGFELDEGEIAKEEKNAALQRSRAHWLMAMGALEAPARRSCFVLVGGLPGTGKSTLALALAERAGFEVIRSDVVRKELAGTIPREPAGFGEGIYASGWTERTYTECLKRAEMMLFRGGRVLVDANFSQESIRRRFLDAAVKWGVPGVFLNCEAKPEIVRGRLANRRGDASDGDWTVYLRAADKWEPFSTEMRRSTRDVETSGEKETAVAAAIGVLRELELVRG